MIRALTAAIALGASLAGCSLVVSGIEVPPADGLDAEVDAAAPDLGVDGGLDAAVDGGPDQGAVDGGPDWGADLGLDAGPDADLDAGDLGPDAGDAAVDGAVDLGPDMLVSPPLDLRLLAGRWRAYGVLGELGLVEATLSVSVLGRASWTFDGDSEQVAELAQGPEAPGVELALPWFHAEALVGAMDPRSGLGVLTSSRAVVYLSRTQVPVPEALVSAAYYVHADYPNTDGEFGVLGELPDSTGYIEDARLTTAMTSPAAQRFSLEPDGDRWRLTSGGETPTERWLSPIKGRRGAIGRVDTRGLALVWNSAAAEVIPTGRWLCGGLVNDGGMVVSRRRVADIDAAGRLTWSNGGVAQLGAANGGVRVVADREPFFDGSVAFALPGPEGHVMALLNRDDAAQTVGYGFALCIALTADGL